MEDTKTAEEDELTAAGTGTLTVRDMPMIELDMDNEEDLETDHDECIKLRYYCICCDKNVWQWEHQSESEFN